MRRAQRRLAVDWWGMMLKQLRVSRLVWLGLNQVVAGYWPGVNPALTRRQSGFGQAVHG